VVRLIGDIDEPVAYDEGARAVARPLERMLEVGEHSHGDGSLIDGA
jgi:hypothetical protein